MINFETNTPKTKIIISGCLLPLAFFFAGPAMMMFGWNAIAWEANLPAFDYLQVFCVCHGLHWFVKGLRK